MMEQEEVERLLGSAITDPDFEKLELALREPNIFRALAIERREIRHSNFLSYLLDPGESHGLREIVLRKFLRDVFSDTKIKGRTLFDADTLDLRVVEIRREWRNIDLLIILPEDVIVVENKVDSLDHSNQLARYRRIADETFPMKRRHFVYLTRFGNDPESQDQCDVWVNYSYAQIAEILEIILLLYQESISSKIHFYLRDYLTAIKQELLMNDKLNELAVRVYNSHRAAFDFVLENRPDPASQLYPHFEQVLMDEGFAIGSRNKGFVRFSSARLLKELPRTGQGWPDREPFLIEIDYFWTRRNAVIKAVIAPGNDEWRAKILDAVKSLTLFQQPRGKKWLVFFIERCNFAATEVVDEDEEEIKRRVRAVVTHISAKAKVILTAIENVVLPTQ